MCACFTFIAPQWRLFARRVVPDCETMLLPPTLSDACVSNEYRTACELRRTILQPPPMPYPKDFREKLCVCHSSCGDPPQFDVRILPQASDAVKPKSDLPRNKSR